MKMLISIFIPKIVPAIGEFSIMMHTEFKKFKSDFGFNLQNKANLSTMLKYLVLLKDWVYHKIRIKMDALHRYYLIWEGICMAWFSRKEVSKSKKAKWLFIILTAVLFLPASYFIYMEEQGNFHPITPGEAYRSAQLESLWGQATQSVGQKTDASFWYTPWEGGPPTRGPALCRR